MRIFTCLAQAALGMLALPTPGMPTRHSRTSSRAGNECFHQLYIADEGFLAKETSGRSGQRSFGEAFPKGFPAWCPTVGDKDFGDTEKAGWEPHVAPQGPRFPIGTSQVALHKHLPFSSESTGGDLQSAGTVQDGSGFTVMLK